MANAGRRERAVRSQDRDRLPPHNLEAEESLLGAMLLSREAVGDAIELVRPDDFFRPSHRQLFEVIVDLYARGETTDLVSVGDELVRRGIMELIGGSETLARLVAETPLISSVERYARIVHEYGILRRLIDAATAIAEEAYGLPTDVRSVLDRAESKILEVASGSRQSAAVGLERVLMEVLDQLEQAANAEDLTSYAVPTGFRDLDELLTGLHRSNLIIVGARPGMGKTSFALSMALNVARTSPEPVLLFSLEMNRLELGQRLVASQARVSSQRLRSGRLTEREWDQVSHAAGELAKK
jgi:replicative DNA helicase